MTSAERLAAHKRRMRESGFIRISAWFSAELAEKLATACKQGERGGRTLECLLLGPAAKRPEFPRASAEEEKQKLQRRVAQMVAGSRARKA